MFTRKIIGAALLSAAAALPALAADFCQAVGDKIALDFEVKPSLVAHSDAIMDTTFGAAGVVGGAPGERLFSFARTIGTILESASDFGGANTPAAREAFVQTMINSFALADGFALNPDAGVIMPLDARSGERLGLSASDLLDETSDQALKPLAVFNRFDLAPADWIHCGEHRIVYGKENPDDPAPPNRFLLIFEAAVPNPEPAAARRDVGRSPSSGPGSARMPATTPSWRGGSPPSSTRARRTRASPRRTCPRPWSTSRITAVTDRVARFAATCSCSFPGSSASG